ncbi:MAG: hypothetical protein PHR82_02165 [Endomicrobiaceae bacterium]|nr:hypothetical protein [Endomicrobiaceae bacterium]
MFNIDTYAKSKQDVIDIIKSTHDWEHTEGFIADGLIDPIEYDKTQNKIIVFLSESYGYDECRMKDITEQSEYEPKSNPKDEKYNLLGIGHRNKQTSNKIPILLWYIHNHFNDDIVKESDGYLKKNDSMLKKTIENKKQLQNALKKSGWINVKKASKHIEENAKNKTRQNYNEIYNAVEKNREILTEQLNSTSPNLIIACGNPVIDGLIDNGIIPLKQKKIKNKLMIIENGQKIFFVSHPSYFKDWNYNNIYNMYKEIVNNI